MTALLLLIAGLAAAEVPEWQSFAATEVIEILTLDEDGDPRETKIWIVVVDGAGYVRTNDSRWLANIRRGSPVKLRIDEREWPVRTGETDDQATYDRVEAAFKTKYGVVQRVMSFFRMTEPTVLRLHFADGAR